MILQKVLPTSLPITVTNVKIYIKNHHSKGFNCAFNVFFQPKPLFEKLDSNKMEEFRQLYSGQQNERNKVN
jgi:hypothetical protein